LFVCVHLSVDYQPLAIRIFFSSWYRKGFFLMGNFFDLPLGMKGEGRKPFLHLLFLKCLQLKGTNIPKCHIGWLFPETLQSHGRLVSNKAT
jgi:hypothetical protein